MLPTNYRRFIGLFLLASLGLLFMVASNAHAKSGYASSWNNLYPGSMSDNAGCQLCHASNTQNLNPYGKALCDLSGDITARIPAVENADSDADSTGSSNITEINANTQPGWTTAAVPTYARGDCSATGNIETAADAGVSGLLDPAPPTTTTTTLPPTTTTTLPPTTTTTTTSTSTTTTTTTTTLPRLRGDVNGDLSVNLTDVILSLQLMTGTSQDFIDKNSDVNDDGRIGLEEAINALQVTSGLK